MLDIFENMTPAPYAVDRNGRAVDRGSVSLNLALESRDGPTFGDLEACLREQEDAKQSNEWLSAHVKELVR
jgi:hypothetical protein